tara:strand:+ start:214 stop:396 length:183 start_codon:yes stop_codon:yes gene_type:complete
MTYFKELDIQRYEDAQTGQLSLDLEHPLDPDVWYHNIEVRIEANRRQLGDDLVARMIVFP